MKRQLAAELMLIFLAFFLADFGGKTGPAVWTQPVSAAPLIVLPPPETKPGISPFRLPGGEGAEPDSGVESGKNTGAGTETGTGMEADAGTEAGTGTNAGRDPAADSPADPAGVPDPAERNTNPLTGLPMDPAAVRRRPVAVVFNNFRRAQPQLGVSQADIVYEVPAEGGITRMLGLFQSLDGVGNLGSIRSTRTYVLELVLGYDALLVHAGGSPAAYEEIPTWGVDNMDGVRGKSDASIFWRDAGRRQSMGYEHSLLTSGESIENYLAKGRYRTERRAEDGFLQRFSQNPAPLDGDWADQITVTFNDNKVTSFAYDLDSGRYLASQYKSAYTDGATGRQVAAENLLILRTTVKQIAGDEAGRLQIDTAGEDDGLYFCGGRYIPIRWSRPDRNSPFTYRRLDGTPLTLKCGKTYICVLGHTDAVDLA